jgi:octanoyl-[GcvH]:protein N-octanoyltransferase
MQVADLGSFSGSVQAALIAQEALALTVAANGRMGVCTWSHDRALLVSARERRLPDFAAAVTSLCAQGYTVCVRPFGGLAVPLDAGVVCVTAFGPREWAQQDAFCDLAALLVQAFAPWCDAAVGEVPAAYCPGRFDIATDGMKWAGIAQRRVRGATLVSAFVNVLQSPGRVQAVRSFYTVACPTDPPPVQIRSERVGSLQEVAGFAGKRSDIPEPARLQGAIVDVLVGWGARRMRGDCSPQDAVVASVRRRYEAGDEPREWIGFTGLPR